MNRIEKLAIKLRADLGIPEDERLDTVDVLRRLKFVGIISEFGPGLNSGDDGVAARWQMEDRSIRVADYLWERVDFADDPEMRFMITHEIAHVVDGHVSRNRKFGGREQFTASSIQDEIVADDLGAAILIPLTFAYSAPIHDADAMSKKFGVPKWVAERRMVELQKFVRSGRVLDSEREDNYAEAMSAMCANARRWNS